jgi:hypothetical protein
MSRQAETPRFHSYPSSISSTAVCRSGCRHKRFQRGGNSDLADRKFLYSDDHDFQMNPLIPQDTRESYSDDRDVFHAWREHHQFASPAAEQYTTGSDYNPRSTWGISYENQSVLFVQDGGKLTLRLTR